MFDPPLETILYISAVVDDFGRLAEPKIRVPTDKPRRDSIVVSIPNIAEPQYLCQVHDCWFIPLGINQIVGPLETKAGLHRPWRNHLANVFDCPITVSQRRLHQGSFGEDLVGVRVFRQPSITCLQRAGKVAFPAPAVDLLHLTVEITHLDMLSLTASRRFPT